MGSSSRLYRVENISQLETEPSPQKIGGRPRTIRWRPCPQSLGVGANEKLVLVRVEVAASGREGERRLWRRRRQEVGARAGERGASTGRAFSPDSGQRWAGPTGAVRQTLQEPQLGQTEEDPPVLPKRRISTWRILTRKIKTL